ncbi:hypothetical protein BCR44DRAFT_24503 [Catenaria anguillulae PL171]|uniref:Uncharacterized protein n=1 Tax=Catenaria anguillulae PL171 TaxID=765915 RepID=A0A1Y2HEE7_9FUNG|nr:hypothetical protein BCR44DRAFT_24503 [Catenaria anguillulae PL171]
MSPIKPTTGSQRRQQQREERGRQLLRRPQTMKGQVQPAKTPRDAKKQRQLQRQCRIISHSKTEAKPVKATRRQNDDPKHVGQPLLAAGKQGQAHPVLSTVGAPLETLFTNANEDVEFDSSSTSQANSVEPSPTMIRIREFLGIQTATLHVVRSLEHATAHHSAAIEEWVDSDEEELSDAQARLVADAVRETVKIDDHRHTHDHHELLTNLLSNPAEAPEPPGLNQHHGLHGVMDGSIPAEVIVRIGRVAQEAVLVVRDTFQPHELEAQTVPVEQWINNDTASDSDSDDGNNLNGSVRGIAVRGSPGFHCGPTGNSSISVRVHQVDELKPAELHVHAHRRSDFGKLKSCDSTIKATGGHRHIDGGWNQGQFTFEKLAYGPLFPHVPHDQINCTGQVVKLRMDSRDSESCSSPTVNSPGHPNQKEPAPVANRKPAPTAIAQSLLPQRKKYHRRACQDRYPASLARNRNIDKHNGQIEHTGNGSGVPVFAGKPDPPSLPSLEYNTYNHARERHDSGNFGDSGPSTVTVTDKKEKRTVDVVSESQVTNAGEHVIRDQSSKSSTQIGLLGHLKSAVKRAVGIVSSSPKSAANAPSKPTFDIIHLTFKGVQRLGFRAGSLQRTSPLGPNNLEWAKLFDPVTGTRRCRDPVATLKRKVGRSTVHPGHLLNGLALWMRNRYGGVPLVSPQQIVAIGRKMHAQHCQGCGWCPDQMMEALGDEVRGSIWPTDTSKDDRQERWEMVVRILSELRALYAPNTGIDTPLAASALALVCLLDKASMDNAGCGFMLGIDDLDDDEVDVYEHTTRFGMLVFRDILTAYDAPMLDTGRAKKQSAAEKPCATHHWSCLRRKACPGCL